MKGATDRSLKITLSIAAVLFAAQVVSTSAVACDAAGPNTHVGQVLGVDGNQFTIRDAQTGESISFSAAKNMQGALPAAGDSVTVKYSEHEKALVAESIQ